MKSKLNKMEKVCIILTLLENTQVYSGLFTMDCPFRDTTET